MRDGAVGSSSGSYPEGRRFKSYSCTSYLPFVQPDRTRGYGPRNKGSNPLWETKGEVLIILKKRLSVHNNEEVVTLGKIIGSLHSLI